ncbi:MAG: hypothetical protein ACJ735_16090 [Actinomycetes bacterium]
MDELNTNGLLHRRSELAALGVDDRMIATRRRAGALQTVRRGRYADAKAAARLAERDRHLLEVRAALSRVKPGARAAKESAALLLGGSIFGRPGAVHLVREDGRPARYPGLIVARAFLPRHHCTSVDDTPTTSAARTVADVARSRPLPQALVVADSLLRAGGCSRDEVGTTLQECVRWPGARGAAVVVAHADARSDNAFESYSRGLMIVHSIDLPELQVWVQGADGRWYRVDFLWRRQMLIGEADGKVKYKVGEDLLEEKRRQESLARRGFQFIRWDWREAVHDDVGLARRWRRRLAELS